MFPRDPRIMAEDQKPEHVRWWVFAVLILGAGVLLFFSVVPGFRLKAYDAEFPGIREGDSAEKMIELMGEPESIEPEKLTECWWGEDLKPSVSPDQVKSVMTYRVSFLFTDVVWRIGLDSDRRVISKRRFEVD